MNTFSKNITIYILVITTGVVFISSLIDTIEESIFKMEYFTNMEEGIYGKLDSLNLKQEKLVKIGQELFEENCLRCHSVNEKVIGSALVGVENRWESKKQLIQFIKNSKDMIKKNSHTPHVYKEYGQVMPNYDFLDDEQVKAILFYIKYQSGEKVYIKL
ncbi:cytochrome c [Bernardetia sp. Wsw4-3y2]|uniref:c-type cytochrome n=1 Tax=unclassified Bernardetia TaxID=2647129 RepID=UPI0030D18D9C